MKLQIRLNGLSFAYVQRNSKVHCKLLEIRYKIVLPLKMTT